MIDIIDVKRCYSFSVVIIIIMVVELATIPEFDLPVSTCLGIMLFEALFLLLLQVVILLTTVSPLSVFSVVRRKTHLVVRG